MARARIYSTPTCSSCHRAKRLLDARGISWEEFDVSFDRTPMIAHSGGLDTVPQVFVDDVHVGGYEDLVAFDRAGGLASDPSTGGVVG